MIITFNADDEIKNILDILDFEDFDFAMNSFLKIAISYFIKFLINQKETCLDNDVLDWENKYHEIN